MRDLETIAKELADARIALFAHAQSNVQNDEIDRMRQDVAFRRIERRYRDLENELRSAIEAEETEAS